MNAARTLAVAVTLTLACAMPGWAAPRVLERSIPASGLDRVEIEAGVGDVRVEVGEEDTVAVEVTLEPRRGGLFSSIRTAEREVQEATLEAETAGRVLRLEVGTDSDQRRFEERWTVVMPARMALQLELGVGDVGIRGLAGGVTLEAGVGDVVVETSGGDLDLEVGVGDLSVRAPAAAYGRVRCAAGVGDARVRVQGEKLGGGGFVGSSASWDGAGAHRIQAELGVGDASVTLE